MTSNDVNGVLNKNSSVSVKSILKSAWAEFVEINEVLDYQLKEVEKALSCYDSRGGCYVYWCASCKEFVTLSLGCNSRLCSCCGKRYADQWAHSLSKSMFDVPHRHFVLSVPDALWSYLRDWTWLKEYMDCAINCFNEFFSHVLRQEIKVGVIVVLHPFGKDMAFKPHLHLILTEGGFNKRKEFVKCDFVLAEKFRKKWQFEILKLFQKLGLPNHVANEMYKKYPKGFYVWLHKRGRIKNPKEISRYLGRYVRHPAIANSRIDDFDGEFVKFHYVNNEDTNVNVTMRVFDFIKALIQHIPPPQFKMIRYYGAYARCVKKRFGAKVHSSIKQLNLYHFGLEKTKCCLFCKNELQFVIYLGKDPPQLKKIQQELTAFIRYFYLKICTEGAFLNNSSSIVCD